MSPDDMERAARVEPADRRSSESSDGSANAQQLSDAQEKVHAMAQSAQLPPYEQVRSQRINDRNTNQKQPPTTTPRARSAAVRSISVAMESERHERHRIAVGGDVPQEGQMCSVAIYDLSVDETDDHDLVHEIAVDFAVRACALSPDGMWLVVGGERRKALLYDLTTLDGRAEQASQALECWGDDKDNDVWVNSVAFSMDGRFLAVGGDDAHVAVHEFNPPLTSKGPDPNTPRAARASVRSPQKPARRAQRAPRSTGRRYSASASDVIRRARSLSESGLEPAPKQRGKSELRLVLERGGPVNSVAFSFPKKSDPGYVRLGAGGDDERLAVYELSAVLEQLEAEEALDGRTPKLTPRGSCPGVELDGSVVREIKVGFEINSVAFSPDHTHVAVGDEDDRCSIFDAQTGALELERDRQDYVKAVAFSPLHGARIAVGSDDRSAVVYDASSGEVELEKRHAARVNAVAWTADASRLLVGTEDGQLMVYDVKTLGQPGDEWLRYTCAVEVAGLALSPDGSRLAVGGDHEDVSVYDLSTLARLASEERRERRAEEERQPASVDPRRKSLGDGVDPRPASRARVLHGEAAAEHEPELEVVSVVWSAPAGLICAALAPVADAADSSWVRLYDAADGAAGAEPSGSSAPIAAFKIDGPREGAPRSTSSKQAPTATVAVSRDGKLLFVGGYAHARVHSVRAVHAALKWRGGGSGGGAAAGGKPRGAGAHADLGTSALLTELGRGGPAVDASAVDDTYITCAAFSHDGALLAVGGYDHLVALYDVRGLRVAADAPLASPATGRLQPVAVLRRKLEVFTLAFSLPARPLDSEFLAVGGADFRAAVYVLERSASLGGGGGGGGAAAADAHPTTTAPAGGGGPSDAPVQLRPLVELKRGRDVCAVAFSAAGLLAVGGDDKKVAVFDSSPAFALRHELKRARCVTTLAFTESGSRLVVGDLKKEILVVSAHRPSFSLLPRTADALTPHVRVAAAHVDFEGRSLADVLIQHGQTELLQDLITTTVRDGKRAHPYVDLGSFSLAMAHNDVLAAELLFAAALDPEAPSRDKARHAAARAIPALIARGHARVVSRVIAKMAWESSMAAFRARAHGAGSARALLDSARSPKPLARVLVEGSPEWRAGEHWSSRIVASGDAGTLSVGQRLPLPCVTCDAMLRALVHVNRSALWSSAAMSAAIHVVWVRYMRWLHLGMCSLLLVEVSLFATTCVFTAWPATAASPAAIIRLNSALGGFALLFLCLELRQISVAYARLKDELRAAGRTVLLPGLAEGRGGSWRWAAALRVQLHEWVSAIDPWVVVDWMSQLVVLASAAVEIALQGGVLTDGRPRSEQAPPWLLHMLAVASLLLLVRVLKAMRGFARLAHFVDVLLQSFADMLPLLFICLTLLCFFALALALQFHPVEVDYDDPLSDDTAELLTQPEWALLGVFNMGMLGDFSVGQFENAASPALTSALFVVQMVVLMIVALNALIALLGDTYDRVTEQQVASRNRQRARLILEYYDVLPDSWQEQIEMNTMWIHRLVPKWATEEGDDDGDDWGGRVAAIAEAVNGDGRPRKELKQLEARLEASLDTKLGRVQRELAERLDGVHATLGRVEAAARRAPKLPTLRPLSMVSSPTAATGGAAPAAGVRAQPASDAAADAPTPRAEADDLARHSSRRRADAHPHAGDPGSALDSELSA